MLNRPWKLSLHMRAEIETPDGLREYSSVHRVSRDVSGHWTVSIERGRHKPTEMSGEGDLPAILEADGVIVILLPESDDHTQPIVPTSTE